MVHRGTQNVFQELLLHALLQHCNCPRLCQHGSRAGLTQAKVTKRATRHAGEPLPQVTYHQANSAGHGPVHEDTDIVQEVNGQQSHWLNNSDPLDGQDNNDYEPEHPVIAVAHRCTLACDSNIVGLPVHPLHHSTLYVLEWQFLAHRAALQTSRRLQVKVSGGQVSGGQV